MNGNNKNQFPNPPPIAIKKYYLMLKNAQVKSRMKE